jgi:hypothetical protein
MHEANKGYSELYIIPGAEHAMSVVTDEAFYREKVKGFLEKTGVIDVR